MTTTIALQPETTLRLDFGMLRRVFLSFGLVLLLFAPLSPDPVELAVGAMVPWVIVQIIGTPNMPAAMVFYLVWQWLQTFTRVFLGVIDGMAMSRSVYGTWVDDAYWYMMASIVVLAAAVRLVLGGTWSPTERERVAHLSWRPIDLFLLYLASYVVFVAGSYAVSFLPQLYQQIDAVAKLKTTVLFLMFATILGLGRGYPFLFAVLGIELVTGFTGLLSEFRGVFIILAMAALAARVRWSAGAAIGGSIWAVVLIGLALFWTAVKTEYRQIATQADMSLVELETQAVTASFDERAGYILDRMINPQEIDWNIAAFALLRRLAYVDIFGSVISVRDTMREDPSMQQWGDALGHVFQPRFLFPNKPGLSDSEVFLRLTKADPTETIRQSTSISVGYMAENYYDMQFPLMLVGIFAVGCIIAAGARYFMIQRLPWMLREALVMGFIYTCCTTGVEASLPKILGSAVMFIIVYAMLIKFAFPIGLRWLDIRAREAAETEARIRAAQQQQQSTSAASGAPERIRPRP